ncbi:MAG: tyrosine-type recombinase/integrase [Lachnospiraceae bacterium]|nr:tyrosine-type recombinase/integrase [Lachnospiraceae bacterium]
MATYRDLQDQRNNLKIQEILNKLPKFASYFFESMKITNKSSRTQLEYAYEINAFLHYIADNSRKDVCELSEKDLETVTPLEIQGYLAKPTKTGNTLSENATARKLSALRSFYKYYNKTKQMQSNPSMLVDMTTKHNREVNALTRDEINALINTIKNGISLSKKERQYYEKTRLRDLAIIYILAGTGIRVSELCGLNITDYDKGNACLHITRKGGNEDKVYFGESVEKAIDEYLLLGRPLLKPLSEETALFISLQQSRMSVRSIEKMIKKYAILANLPSSTHTHTLRASYATALYEETGDVYMIKEALNHSSLETSKHYIAGASKRKRKASKISNDILEEY